MASQNEALVKKRVKELFKQHGVWFAMPVAGSFGRAGIPDFLCCINGWFLAVETKSGRGKCTRLQELELEAIGKAGGLNLVVNEDNFDDLRDLVEKYACPQANKESGTAPARPVTGNVGHTKVSRS